MDSSSLDSELIESLEYLSPPVKRTHSSSRAKFINTKCSIHPNKTLYLRDVCKQFAKKSQYTQCIKRSRKSSTSLILKRTTEREIFEQYSILRAQPNRINLIKETTRENKPIIKVTVIPKAAQTQSVSVCRKRKQNLKRIHNTLSNQESSIHAKDAIVKKEKVNKIKTTGSAQLSKDCNHSSNEQISIDQLTNLNQLIGSLDMDKIKKKELNKTEQKDQNKSVSNDVKTRKQFRECFCSDAISNENHAEISPKRSRIRITGRLGLTPDDRYVLKCAATVDDKPVETFMNAQRDSNGVINNTDLQVEHRRGIFQRDIVDEETNCNFDINNTNDTFPSLESQGTQVDFDIGFTRNGKRNRIRDLHKETSENRSKEVIQCCYCNVDRKNIANRNAYSYSKRNEAINLHKSQSPLVVISVYPGENSNENLQIIKNPKSVTYPSPKVINTDTSSSKSNFIRKAKQNAAQRNQNLPLRKLPKQTFSPKTVIAQNVKSNITYAAKNAKGNEKPSSPKQTLETTNQGRIIPKHDTKLNKNDYKNKFDRKKDNSPKTNLTKKLITTGTNTEHVLAKKALVDTYTKKLTNQMYKYVKETDTMNPVNNNSQVTVNIDGDDGRYDLSLRQGVLSTELRVRKTLKGTSTRKDSSPNSNSLPMCDNKKKASPDKYNGDNKNLYDEDLASPMSKMKLRDSLEIFHRREDRFSQNQVISNDIKKADHTDNLTAQAKHYRGDSCALPDPTRRDKEIKDLLGIGKARTTAPSRSPQVIPQCAANELHCYHGNECGESVLPQIFLNPPRNENKFHVWSNENDLSYQNCENEIYGTNTINNLITLKQSRKANVAINNEILGGKFTILRNHENYTDTTVDSEESNNNSYSNDNESIKCMIPTKNLSVSKHNLKSPMKNKNCLIAHTEYDHNEFATKSPTKCMQVQTPPEFNEKVVKQERASLCQQVILNRKIQVFLQVEQFSDHKPIVLSHKQYDKVKRVIENTITKKKSQRKACVCKCSILSVGDIRKKTKEIDSPINVEKITQTATINLKHSIEPIKRAQFTQTTLRQNAPASIKTNHTIQSKKTTILFTRTANNKNIDKLSTRQTVSSAENTYDDVFDLKHVSLSSTSVVVGSRSTSQKDSCTIRTIFKGFRKSHTPNLGTSACSLFSDGDNGYHDCNSVKCVVAEESKRRKPFFKRLMSCLVLRTNTPSEFKIRARPAPRPPTYNSTIDSYHISTSLGAIEMSSSIYDTSASFYSSHSIQPPASTKVKRGFLDSVRGLLSNRRI